MIPWPLKPPFTLPLSSLPGLGFKRLTDLKQRGISSALDLLLKPPLGYSDRRTVKSLREAKNGEPLFFRATITRLYLDPALKYLKAEVEDQEMQAFLWWFGGLKYFKDQLSLGTSLYLYGQAVFKNNKINFSHPDFKIEKEGDSSDITEPDRNFLGVFPIYGPLGPLVNSSLRAKLVHRLVERLDQAPLILPVDWLAKRSLQDPVKLLTVIHSPPASCKGAIPKPKSSRAWGALSTFELMFWRLLILKAKPKNCGLVPLTISDRVKQAVNNLWAILPYSISPEQKRVLKEILTEMAGPEPMTRLLQGEVGCGKTAVAASAAMAALSLGGQVALMAPTEILARQHHRFFLFLTNELNYFELHYLSGTVPQAERKKILTSLAAGLPSLTVGTHALASPKTIFANLTLAVIDEQHRFGVKQRLALRAKSPKVDLLSLSATPIPSSLAAILYGDAGFSSMIGTLPGRYKPETFVFGPEKTLEARKMFIDIVRSGQQGFAVYPRIGHMGESLLPKAQNQKTLSKEPPNLFFDSEQDYDHSEDDYDKFEDDFSGWEKTMLLQASRELSEMAPELSMGFMHGRLSLAQRESHMEDFRLGKIRILAATSMVEVGVDVPAANVMLVEGAQYFGLAQLHQLRGRVGRGGGKAVFILLSSQIGNEMTQARLKAIKENYDGYALAELDLKLRGPGEELGLKQSGWPLLNFA
ncbi:MAG: DEAD/DEAH box helicase, partial [Deltaproteobacteria bacterium]|nr:DEAD/DEAH box helicase [Deltaproteobacteria bacterium]